MIDSINLDGAKFKIEIVRKRSIKHIYLKIKEPFYIQLRTNTWVSDDYLFDFIEKKSNWILKNHNNKAPNILSNEEMFFLGEIYKKEQLIKKDENIDEFYKKSAVEFITPLVDKYAKIMNLYPTQVKFRKNRSRWGSCSIKNSINLNTQLMKQDERFIEYVVVHELAHIKHKHHQKSFWELVESFMPDYKQRKKLSKLSY